MRVVLRVIFVSALLTLVAGITLALARNGVAALMPALVAGFSLLTVLGLLVAWLLEDAIRENREIMEAIRDWHLRR